MRRKKSPSTNNLQTAIAFCGLVALLILISLSFKVATFFKNSKFDGKHNFTLLIYESKKDRNFEILSVAPNTQSASILRVSEKTPSGIGRTLKIPIDGEIEVGNKIAINLEKDEDLESLVRKSFFSYNEIKTSITAIDLLRLWFYARAVPSHNITIRDLSFSEDEPKLTDEFFDKISNQLFADSTISGEKVSIQVINGTSISGLGNRFARFVSNIGGNVVSVLTSDEEIETSEILYTDENTYTLQRLSRILGYKISPMQEGEISDIVVKLGKDRVNNLNF